MLGANYGDMASCELEVLPVASRDPCRVQNFLCVWSTFTSTLCAIHCAVYGTKITQLNYVTRFMVSILKSDYRPRHIVRGRRWISGRHQCGSGGCSWGSIVAVGSRRGERLPPYRPLVWSFVVMYLQDRYDSFQCVFV